MDAARQFLRVHGMELIHVLMQVDRANTVNNVSLYSNLKPTQRELHETVHMGHFDLLPSLRIDRCATKAIIS